MVSRFAPAPVDVSDLPKVALRGLVTLLAAPFWLLGAVAGLLVLAGFVVARGAKLGFDDVVSRWGS